MTTQIKYTDYFKVDETQVYGFFEDYRFLSNFHLAPITWSGLTYTSAEAAFHSAKTLDLEERAKFTSLSPRDSKIAGRALTLRDNWENIKFDIMLEIQLCKFEQSEELAKKLDETGNKQLIEANHWGDIFWGQNYATGIGKNCLGQCLMLTRQILRTRKTNGTQS